MSYDPIVPDEPYPNREPDPATLCASCQHPRSDHRTELLEIGHPAVCIHEIGDSVCRCDSWREPDHG